MSTLRIFGCLIGIMGLFTTFLVYRGARWNKSNFILLAMLNLSLITITINPNILNVLRDALSLQTAYRGRIIALLIVSNIFLLFYILFTKLRLDRIHFQFDRLVRSLGSKEVQQNLALIKCIQPAMILIPAYNEEENLKVLLPMIPRQIEGIPIGVLVVDDGSDDDSFSFAAEMNGICVVKNIINRGGGAALRLGYDILQRAGVRYCITMDADGQHRPEDIKKLLLPIIENRYDCVIGSRILGGREQSSWLRITGVYFFGRIVSILLGKKITDPSSGFRAFRMEAMASIQLHEDQYHTSELIIEAVKKGLRIDEVPITILKRGYGKSKKGKDLAYGFHFARIIIKTWWR
ncbi:Glycosyl transferase, family 2 [Olavius sp. associated proteobacterium Delta 1]|nr:Glycosyl transferase, family 2 [Olavius sp. associated proteobacterium Delta 1]